MKALCLFLIFLFIIPNATAKNLQGTLMTSSSILLNLNQKINFKCLSRKCSKINVEIMNKMVNGKWLIYKYEKINRNVIEKVFKKSIHSFLKNYNRESRNWYYFDLPIILAYSSMHNMVLSYLLYPLGIVLDIAKTPFVFIGATFYKASNFIKIKRIWRKFIKIINQKEVKPIHFKSKRHHIYNRITNNLKEELLHEGHSPIIIRI